MAFGAFAVAPDWVLKRFPAAGLDVRRAADDPDRIGAEDDD